jgi:hypothetical protein
MHVLMLCSWVRHTEYRALEAVVSISGADAKSFTPLGPYYAKDNLHVFLELNQ